MNYLKIIKTTPITVVSFMVDWCPHCQRMIPTIERVRDDMIESYNTFMINCEHHPDISDMAEVEAYPTIIIYKDGQEVWRGAGEMTADDIKEQIAKAASAATGTASV